MAYAGEDAGAGPDADTYIWSSGSGLAKTPSEDKTRRDHMNAVASGCDSTYPLQTSAANEAGGQEYVDICEETRKRKTYYTTVVSPDAFPVCAPLHVYRQSPLITEEERNLLCARSQQEVEVAERAMEEERKDTLERKLLRELAVAKTIRRQRSKRQRLKCQRLKCQESQESALETGKATETFNHFMEHQRQCQESALQLTVPAAGSLTEEEE